MFTTPRAPTVAALLTLALAAGCVPDHSSVSAGSVTFSVVNEGGDAVSEVELMQGERNLGERENLTPGLSGTFTVQLQPGSYELFCPGAATPRMPFEVTAVASNAPTS